MAQKPWVKRTRKIAKAKKRVEQKKQVIDDLRYVRVGSSTSATILLPLEAPGGIGGAINSMCNACSDPDDDFFSSCISHLMLTCAISIVLAHHALYVIRFRY